MARDDPGQGDPPRPVGFLEAMNLVSATDPVVARLIEDANATGDTWTV
jgi:hypothetical protein